MNALRNSIVACFLLFFPQLLAAQGNAWIGTWATAPQAAIPGHAQIFRHQTVRLIVHVSAGGNKLRIRISLRDGQMGQTLIRPPTER